MNQIKTSEAFTGLIEFSGGTALPPVNYRPTNLEPQLEAELDHARPAPGSRNLAEV
jgi:hypothetical protein